MRILLADDDPSSLGMLDTYLKSQAHEVVKAADGMEALAALEADAQISLLITDWIMPGMNGLELCRQARQLLRPRYLPILLLTSRGQSQDLVDGLNAGADAFLRKPLDFAELEAYLRVMRRILDLETRLADQLQALTQTRDQLQEALLRIEQIAWKDELTQLPNRRNIMEKLEEEIHRAGRYHKGLSVFLLDIDYFKQVNDCHGHQAGDFVLRKCAEVLSGALRESDSIGRYGGEEFLGILPETSLEGAMAQANRFREQIENARFAVAPNVTLKITVSIGVTPYRTGCETLTALLSCADDALYQAKQSGRNRVCAKTD